MRANAIFLASLNITEVTSLREITRFLSAYNINEKQDSSVVDPWARNCDPRDP